MREVKVIGVGMTPFGKFPDRSLKDLAAMACQEALKQAGIDIIDIQAAVVSNAVGGLITGQECIRGQVVLRPLGIGGIPITNVENAGAGGGSALYLAHLMVSSEAADVALVLGMEKLYHPDRRRTLEALASGMDLQLIQGFLSVAANGSPSQESADSAELHSRGRSIFMDFIAMSARMHMQQYGTTQTQLAMISAKNHHHASLNPLAQYQKACSVKEVLASPLVTYPLTRMMCSPISDGAAAVVVCSDEFAKKKNRSAPVSIAASVELSGIDGTTNSPDLTERAMKKAYEMAGIGPDDLSLAEVPDETAFSELRAYETMGFCAKGQGGTYIEKGHPKLGGRKPINTSGGMEARGNPLSAAGLAQVHEAVYQLQGRCEKRQVPAAKTAVTLCTGGAIGKEAAVVNVHILKK